MSIEHAKDYLIDYANNSELWLKALIYESIKTNAAIEKSTLENIYQCLIGSKTITLDKTFNLPSPNNENIELKSLEHISGINALSKNQTVKFCKNITILHGLNGAGKSSYFKILNEIIGGSQSKKIIQNIYTSAPDPIKIKIKYFQNKTEKTIEWNGANRAIYPLTKSRVFDSSYLSGLLDKRETDETLVQPFGLHLFMYITKMMDQFKSDLYNDAESETKKKPKIETSSLQSDLITIFEEHTINKKQIDIIESLYEFSDEKEETLKQLTNSIRELDQINYSDKIKIETLNQKIIKKLLTSIIEFIEQIDSDWSEVLLLLNKYELLKKESETARIQTEILKMIPSIDTEEWKNFIKSADLYSKKIEDSHKFCIYCRQELAEESKKLIQAYTKYLQNDSEIKLQNHIEEITKKTTSILQQSYKIDFNDESYENIKEYINDIDGKSIQYFINTFQVFLTEEKKCLLEVLQVKKKAKSKPTFDHTKVIIENLNIALDNIAEKIKQITADSESKEKKVNQLKVKFNKLLQNKSISEQKLTVQNWIKLQLKHDELVKIASSINTAAITKLANKAHDELLTEKLKSHFTNELSSLGFSNLSVTIEKAGASKAKASTKMVICNDHHVSSILSEGEQKAAGLALFLSEIKMQNSMNPVIFDDPVNSLDHRIAEKFAERLLSINNQVIIFNHNRLFLDAFETDSCNHICKTINTDCNNNKGKHIRIYEVRSEGQNQKGVLFEYKSARAENLIDQATNALKKSPFDESLIVSALIRRAVESIIDEKILNNVVPTKYSNKNNRINWDGLSKISPNSADIEELKTIHSRASGGELHNGIESQENAIEKPEFEEMIKKMNIILSKP